MNTEPTRRRLLVTQPGMTDRGPAVDVIDASGDPMKQIARFHGETAEADAFLFAAAPELLAALQKIADQAVFTDQGEWIRSVARSALSGAAKG